MKAITMLEILQHSFKDLADVEHKQPLQRDLLGTQAIISGDYHDGEINLYLVCNSLDNDLCATQTQELEYEAEKTYAHEYMHLEQDCMGMLAEVPIDQSHKDYLLTPHEVEAYARVDIPNDIRRYGVSPDLQAYAKLLSEKRMMETQQGITAYDILRFYHTPIDDYLDKWQEGIQ